MTDERVKESIILPVARCGFPKLNPSNPPLQGIEPNKRKRWSINVYFDPTAKTTLLLKEKLQEAAQKFEELHGYEPAKVPKLKRMGEYANKTKTKLTHPSLIGMVTLDLGTNAEKKEGGMHPPPAIVGADREPVPHSDIYPGCYVRVIALLDEYKVMNGQSLVAHGLAFQLKVVQFIKDGERMGGDTTDYLAYLDDVEDDEENDAVGRVIARKKAKALVSDDEF